jgi:putative polyhydroxyalkanoate system protein
MSTIHIEREHTLTPEQARSLVEGIVAEVEKKVEVEYAWEGHHLKFKAKGIKGEIQLGDDKVLVLARLGLMLAPFKGKIEHHINAYLDANLA